MLTDFPSMLRFSLSPRWPFLVSSHPQLSKSPRLQFLVRVYMTPAELMAWKNAVSLFAVIRNNTEMNMLLKCYFINLVYEILGSRQLKYKHSTSLIFFLIRWFTQIFSIHLSNDGFWLLFPLHQTWSSAVGLLSYIVSLGSALDCNRSPLWHLRNA